MQWLNYHHLLYFWTVAREGSIVKASAKLHLAQPTISGQIKTLEENLGEKLLSRSGRGLVLTEVGQLVYDYADEIFGLGNELIEALRGRPSGRQAKLVVGISDVVPKLISHRILSAALKLDEPVQLVCVEDKTERLLAQLSVHGLDMVLSDQPITGAVRVQAFNHLLGQCGVSFMAAPQIAARHRLGFPGSLRSAPMLLPTNNTVLRRELDQWFDRHDIRPRIVAEFEDSALLKVFGEKGNGIFAAPAAIEDEIAEEYGVELVGRTDEVVERFYFISVERRISNPAVAAITAHAKEAVFGGEVDA